MKIGLYADPHFSQSSSIIVGHKGEFTGRLDNLIKSFSWMNEYFKSAEVDCIICLGDLTDKPNLTSEEITALSRCDLDNHILLVGNHCRSDKDGVMTSLSIYKNVINTPTLLTPEILLLPYNSTSIDLSQYKGVKVILSHNDIKGYDFGSGHVSSSGYDVQEILDTCRLFINGHLHNGGWLIKDRVVNLGCLSGMNFASCGGEWEPSIAVLEIDNDTVTLNTVENPEAYRFKKVEFDKLTKLKGYLDNLPETGNYVLQVKVPHSIAEKSRKLLDQSKKVSASRVLTFKEKSTISTTQEVDTKFETKSVYEKLSDFVASTEVKYSRSCIGEIIKRISSEEEGET